MNSAAPAKASYPGGAASGMPGIYETIADEYYDAAAHPTCHNLNTLSRIFIERALSAFDFDGAEVVEVGCGSSVIAPLMHRRGMDLAKLELQDASSAMLRHSSPWGDEGAALRIARADSTGRRDASVDLLVASLGDPYNDRPFWTEAARIVRPKGVILFTCPSFAWARTFRVEHERTNVDAATFVLRDGRQLTTPSFVRPPHQQMRMIEKAGFMVTVYEAMGLAVLPAGQKPSWKLTIFENDLSSIVCGFRAVRLGRRNL
jgi:SAM-dependent methyltransferase